LIDSYHLGVSLANAKATARVGLSTAIFYVFSKKHKRISVTHEAFAELYEVNPSRICNSTFSLLKHLTGFENL
jgi:hypothetical protein